MAEYILNRKLTIAELPRNEVFQFFADAQNLQEMCPPELNFTILTPKPIEITKGTIIEYKLSLYGFPFRWKTLISGWNPPRSFVDKSLKGPYKQWVHRHVFTENKNGGTDMEDIVCYRLPFEPLSVFGHWWVQRQLKHIFDFRETAIFNLIKPA